MALKYHTLPQGEVAYYQRGMGDPLLLVHGIYPGASHDEFQHNIDALAHQYTVHAIDLLGFGDSDKPHLTYTAQFYQHLLRDFIIQVIGKPAHIIASGQSCGAAVSLAVYDYPLAPKLVLIDPIMDPPDIDAPPALTAKVQQFLLGTLSLGTGLYDTISSKYEIKRYLRSRYASDRKVTARQIDEMHERASQRHAMYAIISNMTGQLSLDMTRWLRYVRSQVLVIWGQHAGPAPVEQVQLPASWSRGKRIEIIPKSAHWPHDEQSAKVNALLLEFLA